MTLLASTGNPTVDGILLGLVGLFETVFPGRARGYYLTGSFADGSARPFSDIDMCVLFREGFRDPGEEARAERILEHCSRISPIELDVAVMSERIHYRLRAVNVKRASRLIYGEDVRDRIPLPPIDAYARDAMDVALRRLANARLPRPLTFPLEYPDPAGEFYGYDQGLIRSPEGVLIRGTKNLLVNIGLAATAILALQAGQYVGSKGDCIRLYRTHIGDQWAELVEAVYAHCRDRWGYRVPDAPEERRRLQELCRRGLAFENHFLALCREHFLAELRQPDEERRLRAVRQLGAVLYPDEEIAEALRQLAESDAETLRRAVAETMQAQDKARLQASA